MGVKDRSQFLAGAVQAKRRVSWLAVGSDAAFLRGEKDGPEVEEVANGRECSAGLEEGVGEELRVAEKGSLFVFRIWSRLYVRVVQAEVTTTYIRLQSRRDLLYSSNCH